MERIRNNAVNRIFHKKETSENIQRKHKCERLIALETDFIDRIGTVEYSNSTRITGIKSLVELLAIHKEAWKQGFRNENLGPNKCFRTNDIAVLQPYEVLLGGIHELDIKSLPFWENQKFEVNGAYQIVLGQYKEILTKNIKAIADEAKKELDLLFSLGY